MAADAMKNPWVRAGLGLGALVLVCFAAYALSFVLVPLLLAFLVAYALDPVVDALERLRMRRSFAVGVLAITGILLALSVPLFVVPTVLYQAKGLVVSAVARAQESAAENESSLWERISDGVIDALPLDEIVDLLGWRETPDEAVLPRVNGDEMEPDSPESEDVSGEVEAPDKPVAGEREPATVIIARKIESFVRGNASRILQSLGASALSWGQTAGSTAVNVLRALGEMTLGFVVFLANFAVFAFVSGYLLLDYDRVIAGARELTPPRIRPKLFDVMGRIDGQARGFLRGQLAVCAIMALMYLIGFTICGTPLGLLIALFGGVASFIPYLGAFLTVTPALLFTLIAHGAGWEALGVVITFIVVQSVEGNILTPQIVGNQVGLHPVWVILAVLVFGNLLGLLGMLAAVPLAAVLKVLVEEGVEYYKGSALFTAQAAPPGTRKPGAKRSRERP